MTNEEIYLYKKAQNGGKSDPRNALVNKSTSVAEQELNYTATVELESEE